MCSAEPVRLHPVIAAESGHIRNEEKYSASRSLRDDQTFWCSPPPSDLGAAPGWIAYDMQEPCFITRIGFRGYPNHQCPRDVILQSSDAQEGSWTDVLFFKARQTRDLQEFAIPEVPRASRFWRVLMNTNHGQTSGNGGKYCLTEMTFFGVRA